MTGAVWGPLMFLGALAFIFTGYPVAFALAGSLARQRPTLVVSPDLIGSTTWTGTAAELRQRLDDAASSGVTEFMYAPMGSDLHRELEAVRALF